MNEIFPIRFLDCPSDNLKPVLSEVEGSKTCPEPRRRIQNLKWVGIFAVLVLFLRCVSMLEAQQPTKIPRIGVLTGASLSSQVARNEAFRQGLRELGYVEGKNIVIEWRSWEGNRDRQRA